MASIKMSEIRAKFPMYDDMPDERLLSAVRSKYYADIPMGKFAKMVDFDTQRQALQKEITDEAGTPRNLAAGVGQALTNAARGVGQLTPLVSRSDVEETRKLDAGLSATTAGAIGNFIGNTAIAAPLTMLAPSIAGATATGAALGFLQPSTSTQETVTNTGLGGVAGAIVPLAARGVQVIKAAAQPFTQAGRQQIIGSAIETAAGPDAAAVRGRLQQAAQPFTGPQQGAPRSVIGELVPGSMPTVGQTANNAGVAALERAAYANNPAVTTSVSERMAQQNAARSDLLRNLAGSDGLRDFTQANRDATAELLYGAAMRKGIDPARLTPQAVANVAQFQKRMPDAVVSRARELAKLNGMEMTDDTSLQGLHWTKKALDDLISSAKARGDKELSRAYTKLQKDLLTGIDRLSPDYRAARKVYQSMSKPLNEMDTVQALMDRSTNALTGVVQPAAYARALSDKTAQSATGFKGATLENALENTSLNKLQSLFADLQRSNFAQNAGRGAGSDTVQKLAYSNIMGASGMPTFVQGLGPVQFAGNVLSRVGDAAYGRANRELSQQLAETMLDPQMAAAAMAQARVQGGPNVLLNGIRYGGAPLAIGFANARQQ
jgi:hypothetical protein